MLVILLILTLVRHLQSAPLVALDIPTCDPSDAFVHTNDIYNHLGTRGVQDIIVSCIATIFACTWTAIHPNIPAPHDCGWDIFKGRLTTMVYALLAPEAVTAWAMRQHIGARLIANFYNEHVATSKPPRRTFIETVKHNVHEWLYKKPFPPDLIKGEVQPWTITHGFFIQMGGFMLRQDGRPVRTLRCLDIFLKSRDDLGLPITITEAEIQDRSKGDLLSKIIVVLQTTWFIVECIARWSSGLPVTQIEVVTLGYAMLNALTYGLWWNKPQSVGMPVFVEMKTSIKGEQQANTAADPREEMVCRTLPSQCDTSATNKEGSPLASPDKIEPNQGRELGNTQDGTDSESVEETKDSSTDLAVAATEKVGVTNTRRSFFSQKLEIDRKSGWQLIWRLPYRFIHAALRPLSKMLHFSEADIRDADFRVSIFFSYIADDTPVLIISSLIAMLFGLIHLVPAWFLNFPTYPEMLLWRVSALLITVQPLILCIWATATRKRNWHKRRDIHSALTFISLVGLPFYMVARFILLVLSLFSLRQLPEASYVTIDWISFVPHV